MTPDLSGDIVFITGASRGLGKALAHAFADTGASLVLCARGADGLDAVARELAERTPVVHGALDVSDAGAVNALVARAREELGSVSVLVNNASILGPRVPLRDLPLEAWRSVMDVNLTGTLVPTLAVLPGMRKEGRGSIINVSSGVGNVARRRWGAYAVSKWGVESLSGNLALEEEDSGIRVNVVDPGSMQTEMRREAYPQEDPRDPAPPRDVTGVFLWLASPEAEDVTGERFHAQKWSPT